MLTRKIILICLLPILIGTIAFLFRDTPSIPDQISPEEKVGMSLEMRTSSEVNEGKEEEIPGVPIDNACNRVTKKPFGVRIVPETSPVQPERFSGYHTGIDFETFPEEADTEVTVRAFCDGEILVKRFSSGYGGITVTRCVLNGQEVTVLYGHLALPSITKKVGEMVRKGDILGILGKGGSSDTDGERKHLHLGIHKGTLINVAGYVAEENSLNDWVNPDPLICPE